MPDPAYHLSEPQHTQPPLVSTNSSCCTKVSPAQSTTRTLQACTTLIPESLLRYSGTSQLMPALPQAIPLGCPPHGAPWKPLTLAHLDFIHPIMAPPMLSTSGHPSLNPFQLSCQETAMAHSKQTAQEHACLSPFQLSCKGTSSSESLKLPWPMASPAPAIPPGQPQHRVPREPPSIQGTHSLHGTTTYKIIP